LARVYANGERVKDIASGMGRTTESLYKVVQRLRVTLRNCIEQRLAEARGRASKRGIPSPVEARATSDCTNSS